MKEELPKEVETIFGKWIFQQNGRRIPKDTVEETFDEFFYGITITEGILQENS